MLSANLSAIFYLVSGVLFILALRGLSSPETSRQGNFFGILGMVIAIIVTFLSTGIFSTGFIFVLIFILVGGSIGAFIAYRIPMTAMPELVAGFHSLVGLAAVFVAISAFLNPEAFNLGVPGNIKLGSLIEMSIGAAVGAITFSGSVIAFLKLQGIMSGSPITFKGQHPLNVIILISIIVLTYLLCSTQSSNFFWILLAVSFLIGFLLIIPIGGADMPVVISMLNSYSGWAAAGIGFTLENTALIITGALVGSSGAILSYIMCKGMNRSFFNVILGGFGATEEMPNLDLSGDLHQLNPSSFDHKERSAWLGAIVAPRPLCLVSTISKNGIRNIAPMSSVSVVSNSPPLIGMSLSKNREGRIRDTLQNLIDTEKATLSILPPHMDIVRWIEASAQPLASNQSEWMDHAAVTSEGWPDAPAVSLVALQTTLVARHPLPEGSVAEWIVLRVDGILSPTLNVDHIEKEAILTILTDTEIGDARTLDTWHHKIERPD